MTTISSGLPVALDFDLFRGSRFAQRAIKAFIVDGVVPDWSTYTATIEIFDQGVAIPATATIVPTTDVLSYTDPETGDTVSLGSVTYYSIDIVVDDVDTDAIVQSRRLPVTIAVTDASDNNTAIATGYCRVRRDGEAVTQSADELVVVVDTANDVVILASAGGSSGLQSVVAGTNVTIDDTDPLNPVINASITGGGGGDVVGPASAVDSEVPLFSGITGKLLKRATGTGIAKLASGVLSVVSRLAALAELPQITTARLLGRTTAGTGDVEELSDSTVRTFLNVEDGATANSSDATLLARANHTGTQAISTVAGLQTALDGKLAPADIDTLAELNAIVADATLIDTGDSRLSDARTPTAHAASHNNGGGDPLSLANLAGDLTLSRISDSGALAALATVNTAQIDNNAVTNAKLADVAQDTLKGRVSAGSGDPEDLTAIQVRAVINVEDGANAYVHPNHSGDVTSVADGAQTIAANAVTNAKLADMAAWTVKLRNAGTSGDPSDAALADVTEEASPASGDFLLGFLDTGEIRKFDVGNIGGGASPLTTKGDLYTYSTVDARLPVGADGEMLYADSGETTGLRWDAPPSGSGDVAGPASSVDDEVALFSGTSGKVIKRATGSGIATLVSGVLSVLARLAALSNLPTISTARILGRNTAGTGDIEELDDATIRSMINVEDGANNYTHPNHTGDVTSTGDGATVIANDVVTNAKLANIATQTIKGRITAATGDPEDLTAIQVRTIINVEDGATADQTAGEIKTAYESNADTNAFTDADESKLDGIEAGADVTDAANVAAAGAVMDSDFSVAEGFMRKISAGTYEAIKSNLSATSDPGVSDDNTAGYAISSRWVNVTADKEFVALDVSTGAAVWKETTAGAGGGISNVVEDTTPQLGGELDMNGNGINNGSVVISPTEIGYLDGVTSAIQTQIDGKQPLDTDLTTLASAFTTASASGPASLALAEDTDNGSNTATLIAQASMASNLTITLPAATGTLLTDTDIGTSVQAYDVDTAKLDVAQEYSATQNFNATTLTDGATIDWNLAANQVGIVTLGGNRTLNAPTNQAAGATYIIIIKQDGTGSRTLTWNSAYKFPGGTDPTLTTAANAIDVVSFVSDGTNMLGVAALNFS